MSEGRPKWAAPHALPLRRHLREASSASANRRERSRGTNKLSHSLPSRVSRVLHSRATRALLLNHSVPSDIATPLSSNMPRAFLIKKKHTALVGGRPTSPKLFSPASSGIASPNSSSASTSSSSPLNDENELAAYQTSSPKYSFDRDNQCLDLSMKSLLKEANTLGDKSAKTEYSAPFSSALYHEPLFVSSYPYPSKFAKIGHFLRTGEVSKSALGPFSHLSVSPRATAATPSSSFDSKSSTPPATSLFKPVNYPSIESVQNSCHRLAPYSINWSEHFSVNKLVSPTPSSLGSDDSGRGSDQSDDMCTDKHILSARCSKLAKKSDRFQCPDCNKSYSTQSGLAKHQEFHCSSQVKKSFSCKHCDKVYVSLGALKMHIRTHTLPCKCKLCGKAFSRPWLLQGHIRTHTGEKPFACQYCNRAFADRSNLRAHLQTHSVVKKYNCKSCSRTFSRMSLLLKHEDNGCNSRSLGAHPDIAAEVLMPSIKVE